MIEIVSLATQGPRAHMEDRHAILQVDKGIFGIVLDGHGGEGVAEYGKEHFFEQFVVAPGSVENAFRFAFAVTHDRAPRHAGGACVVAFYLDGDLLTVANTGDSHALLVHPAGLSKLLTVDHRLGNVSEHDRIVNEYHAFTDGVYTYHPDGGGLMPTRSIGDHPFNDVGIIPDPDISTHEFKEGYLIVATDGLWDYTNQTAVAACCEGTAEEVGKKIQSLASRTQDNLTIIVLKKS